MRIRSLAVAALLAPAAAPGAAGEKIILFSNSGRDLAEFRAFAHQAARMKKHGRVQIDIGVLASRAAFELPPGGCDWHQYAVFNANLSKFFPHPDIAPFYPAPWVAENRSLLRAKAAILAELGLEAAMSSNDTHYLPEPFFDRHPHLRGPRVDHPRRSRTEEFTWCVDLAETRAMIEWMTAEARRNVPMLRTILMHVNDSGTGLCWADHQYSGPNGPEHCRTRGVGLRFRELAEAVHRGAVKGGGDVDIRLGGQLSTRELDDIAANLPPRTWLSGRDPLVVGGHGSSDRDLGAAGVRTLTLDTYPVLGLINVVEVLAVAERLRDPRIRTFVLGTCLPWYYRYDESVPTTSRLIEIVEASTASAGSTPAERLRTLAARWGGDKHAAHVAEAFTLLDEALRMKARAGRYATLYAGVSTRHITRPLVLRPAALSHEEKHYFLPFVFNVSEAEAEDDYIDVHGGRIAGPAWGDPVFDQFLSTTLRAAALLEEVPGAPEQAWLRRTAASLRMWASVVQSTHHFLNAQRIRDLRKADLAGPPRMPPKTPGPGDPDFLKWYAILRRELDNTVELIRLLENGGLSSFAHAKKPEDQDAFVLGPDIAGDLARKRRIMRAHWLEAQSWLAAPFR